ncbi:hypothetical protein ACFV4Q_26055 [Streptomyces nojiriensis]|uniref:hypothetical protein n=1 Tax=Streptomyces nojiriensis TaxID=66374 RepID=UPI0036493B41
MKHLDTLKQHGDHQLVTAARAGVHTLPQQILDDYTALEAHLDAHTDSRGNLAPGAAKEADRLTDAIMRAKAWGNAPQILVDHVQPALARFLDDLAADLKTAGRHAVQPGATIDMLDEPDHVRAAILRLHSAYPTYGHLRASWRVLRSDGDTVDPLGLTSPLAEVANLPDLVPDWEPAHHGRTPWPWHTTVFHVRMGWLLDRGARLWLPTAAQQTEAWHKAHPEARVRQAA